MPRRRDILLARFPFTDQSQAKLRPVLILAEVPGNYRDYVVLFISSQLGQATELDLALTPDSPAFASSGLKVASVFKVGKVATISDGLMVGVLGQLQRAVFDDVLSVCSIYYERVRFRSSQERLLGRFAEASSALARRPAATGRAFPPAGESVRPR